MDRDPFDFEQNPPTEENEAERPEGGEDDPALMGPVLEALKTVRDPEIPMDLVELGLIYELIVKKGGARLCRDDPDDPRLPGRRQHAGRSRDRDPRRSWRHRRWRQTRLDPTLGAREDERRGTARARDAVGRHPLFSDCHCHSRWPPRGRSGWFVPRKRGLVAAGKILNASPAKAGAHLSAARGRIGGVPASARTAAGLRFRAG